MDHQPSIRSFFRPTSTSQPQTQQAQTTPPHPQSKTHLPPPPPVLKASSYALPPSSISKSQTPPPSRPTQQPPLPCTPQLLKRNPLLPPQATISPILASQIPSLRRINALLLPIAYSDSFYTSITDPACSQHLFSRVIEWEGKVVGGMVCRVDDLPLSKTPPQAHSPSPSQGNTEQGKEIYIQSLTLLSPFRGKGLASIALSEIIQLATTTNHTSQPRNTHEEDESRNIKGLYAHVWTQNQEALEWYHKHGFVKSTSPAEGVGFGGVITGYYRRLKPDTAFLLRRQFLPSDFLSQQETTPARNHNPPQEQPETKKEMEERRPPLQQQGRQTRSFQDRGPEREWNDLPLDVVGGNGLLKVNGGSTGSSSRASSRGAEGGSGSGSGSGSGKGGRKKRVYPAAAFAG